jgi:hypothetical protein
MLRILTIALTVFFMFVPSAAYAREVHVRGHASKRGIYVVPHMRTSPDHSYLNNWSSKGNVNPYTGRTGSKRYR